MNGLFGDVKSMSDLKVSATAARRNEAQRRSEHAQDSLSLKLFSRFRLLYAAGNVAGLVKLKHKLKDKAIMESEF